MIEACDPDADIEVLRKFIKMNTGQDVKLTKKQICQVYDDIKDGKLPLPPLVMNASKTYLIDRKSPLNPRDYEILFNSSSKRADLKKVARKVGLKQVDQMTKNQVIDSIGKRLRYMKVHEPVKISRRRVKKTEALVNTNVNRFNNTAVKNEVNNTAVNTNVNKFNNTAVKTNVNRFNNTAVNTNVNKFNNTAVKNEVNTAVKTNVNKFNNTLVKTNVNRFNNTAVKNEVNTAVKPPTQQSRVIFPKGSLFKKGQRPKFLNGRVSAVKKPIQQFVASNTSIDPEPAKRRNNLLMYLKPLKINQLNKNSFLTRLNNGESIDVLKREAKSREIEITGDTRSRLMKRLDELELNAQDRNSVMSRFDDGIKNINKLMNQARKLKKRRDGNKIAAEKKRLTTLAKQLNVFKNFSTSISRLNIVNAIEPLEKRITDAGVVKKGGEFTKKIQKLSTIAREMSLDADIKSNILTIKTDADVNASKIRIIDAGKKKLYEQAQSLNVNYSSNIEKIKNVENLTKLRAIINKAGAQKKIKINKIKVENLAKRKRALKNVVQKNGVLPREKKNSFITQINVNGANLDALRKNINAEIQKVKNTKREKNLDELKKYIAPLNINTTLKNGFIEKFKTSDISLSNIKIAVNKEVSKKGDITSKKRVLSDKIKEARDYGVVFNFNVNVNSVENIENFERKVDTFVDTFINKKRNALSNKVIEAKLKGNIMNKITSIKTIKNVKTIEKQIDNMINSNEKYRRREITLYMKRRGFDNQDIKTILMRNLSVENSRKEVDDMLKEKKRLNLTKYLDEKKVPVAERKQFYDKTTNLASIKRNVDRFISGKRKQIPRNIGDLLNKYDLKNEDRRFIINEWMTYPTMTPTNVENLASKRSEKFKKEKNIALRSYLTVELGLEPSEVEKIMQEFQVNPRNYNALRKKAMKSKGLSKEKNRIAERVRKAQEDGIDLNFNTNVKNMNNVKNLNTKINGAYIEKEKKNLSRKALNNNINISNDLNRIKSMNNVRKLKNKLNALTRSKKNTDLQKLQNVTRELDRESQERFLKRFRNQGNSLNVILKNVEKYKNELKEKKQVIKRQELYTYISNKLNLNVTDRNAIMKEFDNVKNVNAMKTKANAIKKQRTTEKVKENRIKLEEILKGMNLEEGDKRFILLRFDRKPGNVNAFEANAKKLVEQKKANKRSKEVSELDTHMKRLGLSDENKQKILNVFKQNPDKTLNSAKTNASIVRQKMNQRKLETAMNTMKNLTENNKAEFRKKLIEPQANLGVIIKNAQARNASMRSKKTTERNVADYIAALGIGETGNKLLENFRKGTLTANKAKEEADKKKKSLNANVLVEKKKKLRAFMNKTLLTNANKDKFVNRVTLKENTTALEKEITILNTQLKSIDDSKKKGKKVRNERAKPKEENNFNANKAMNILNKQREGEAKRLERAKPKEENNFNTAKALKNLNNSNRMAKRQKVLNEIAKHTNERITKFKGRAGNPFRTAEEYNKIGENVKKMVELVKTKNREALKKLLKSTKTNQKQSNEYMNAFEKGRKTFKELKENITMKAKRNALVRKIDKKPVKNENDDEAMEASRLFNVGGDVKNLTRGKNEREVDKNVLEKTRKLVGFGIGGKSREKFLVRGRGMQNTRPLVKELDERLTLINKVKNLPNRKELEKVIRNSNTTINRVRIAIKASQNKQNKNIANASKSLVAGAIGKIQKKENKNIANASKSLVAGAISNLKKKNAAARKIQATFRRKKDRNANENNGEISAAALAPKPSFSALAQKNTKKVANAAAIFNRRSATSVVNRLKKLTPIEKTQYKGKISRANTKSEIREIQESAVRVDARKKFEENKKKEEERKKRVEAEAERARKMKEKKATREAAERAAESAKKMLTETEKMRAKAKENKKFNNKLAEKRRLLREREAKSQPKKRKPKKKQ
jgi:hypothetical protein